MKIYAAHGVSDFVVCCGYKGWVIKEYFASYCLRTSDVTFDLRSNAAVVHNRAAEPWRVTLVDTGDETMTGGRLWRAREHLDGDTFCLTYGDGVADVHIGRLIEFHRRTGVLVTMTAVQPEGRFGAVTMAADGDRVSGFKEKPRGDGAWINGGFFVCEPSVLDYIEGDATVWEDGPLRRLAADGQLAAYRHTDFWHPMDTLRDREVLERLWSTGCAPWKVWP
jgi:glucose-1-phosphate cytidylyltransferase